MSNAQRGQLDLGDLSGRACVVDWKREGPWLSWRTTWGGRSERGKYGGADSDAHLRRALAELASSGVKTCARLASRRR